MDLCKNKKTLLLVFLGFVSVITAFFVYRLFYPSLKLIKTSAEELTYEKLGADLQTLFNQNQIKRIVKVTYEYDFLEPCCKCGKGGRCCQCYYPKTEFYTFETSGVVNFNSLKANLTKTLDKDTLARYRRRETDNSLSWIEKIDRSDKQIPTHIFIWQDNHEVVIARSNFETRSGKIRLIFNNL